MTSSRSKRIALDDMKSARFAVARRSAPPPSAAKSTWQSSWISSNSFLTAPSDEAAFCAIKRAADRGAYPGADAADR